MKSIVWLSILSLLFSGCRCKMPPRDPQQVGLTFVKAMKAHDYETAQSLVVDQGSASIVDLMHGNEEDQSMWSVYLNNNASTIECHDMPDGTKSCDICCGTPLHLILKKKKSGRWAVDLAQQDSTDFYLDTISNMPDSLFDNIYDGEADTLDQ